MAQKHVPGADDSRTPWRQIGRVNAKLDTGLLPTADQFEVVVIDR